MAAAREAIAKARGCKLVDDLESKQYPMPLDTSDQDLVYVGRIRDDLTDERALALWCAGDQIRKGAGHQRRADRGIVAVREAPPQEWLPAAALPQWMCPRRHEGHTELMRMAFL